MSFYVKLILASIAIAALTIVAFTLSTSALSLIPSMEWRSINTTITDGDLLVVRGATVVVKPGVASRVYDNAWCRIIVVRDGARVVVERSVAKPFSFIEWLVCDNARAVIGSEERLSRLNVSVEAGVLEVDGINVDELSVRVKAGVVRIDANIARRASIVNNAGVLKCTFGIARNTSIVVENGSGVAKLVLNTTSVNLVKLVNSAGVVQTECERGITPRVALVNSAGVLVLKCKG